LAEVVLAILKDRDDSECRRLPDALGQLPGKDEGEQVNTRCLEGGGERPTEHPNEERWEDEAANEADRIAKKLRDIARSDRRCGCSFAAEAEL
jgi:hypothetical protein